MSETTTYTVSGMTCEHCAASVTEEISEITGVEGVDVVVETGAVTVTSTAPLDESAVRAAVELTSAVDPVGRATGHSRPPFPAAPDRRR